MYDGYNFHVFWFHSKNDSIRKSRKLTFTNFSLDFLIQYGGAVGFAEERLPELLRTVAQALVVYLDKKRQRLRLH